MSAGTADRNSSDWDYSLHARYYRYRPNYAPEAIRRILEVAGSRIDPDYVVTDVGAGTGNLTLLLLEEGLHVIALEPNQAMRELGIEATSGKNVEWRVGTGESTGLDDASVSLFAMGSSFNTTDRERCLDEAARVLVPGGWFTCMWNNRELEDDPVQAQAEAIIREFCPDYSHGSRREDQTPILAACPHFDSLEHFVVSQRVAQPLESYLAAWRSVRNRYWDLHTPEGQELFGRIEQRMRAELPQTMEVTYDTRVWMTRRI